MPRLLRASLILVAVLCAFPVAGARATDSGWVEGAWARYRVASSAAAIPDVDQLLVSTPRVEATSDGAFVWFQMEAFRRGERVFAVAMLVSDLDFLRDAGAAPVVRRYLLYPAQGEPLEYVDAATGSARLPRFGLFDGLLPIAPQGAPRPFSGLTEYLGRTLTLEREGASGARPLPNLIGHHRVLPLDDRVLVGSSRSFRDDGSGQTNGNYTYVPLGAEDYREMIDAGFNLFRIPAGHFGFVAGEPVFFLMHTGTGAHPDLFYRSNYDGGVMYMDEPEVRVTSEPGFRDIVHPEAAATATAEFTAEMAAGSTLYGRGYLAARTAAEGWNLGPRVELTEPTSPSWVSRWGTSWYQAEAGVSSVVAECRIDPAEYSDQVAMRFGVDFPAEPGPWLRFLMGMQTGAAQRFGGEWGISLFGQASEEVGDMAFRMAYERGARLFWVWTSDADHHLPHARQLQLVRSFRDWLAWGGAASPRTERPVVAITIPWGYNCDQSNFNKDQQPGHLWYGSDILLDDLNSAGVAYRDVLTSVYRTYLERIARHEEVDLLYEKPGEPLPYGEYAAIYRVLETGTVLNAATAVPVGASAIGEWAAFPNPFDGVTGLRLQVGRESPASVRIFDAAGRLVRTLAAESALRPGSYTFLWNGRNDAGAPVAGGVYFARVATDGEARSEKLVRLR